MGEIAFALWQQQRLQALAALALAAAEVYTDVNRRHLPPAAARYRARLRAGP